MTTRTRKGIFLALEGISEDADVSSPEENLDFLQSAENPIVDMIEASEKVDNENNNVDEAISTTGALSDIGDAVEQAVEQDGGLSEPVAQALRVAVEHFSSRLGASAAHLVFPAMEGFELTAPAPERAAASGTVLSGIVDLVKRIWQAIVSGMKRIVGWVSEFFDHLLNSSEKLARRANAIKGQVHQAKSGLVNDSHSITGKSARFARHLKKDGQILSPGDFTKELVSFVDHKKSEADSLMQGMISLSGLPGYIKTKVTGQVSFDQLSALMIETLKRTTNVFKDSVKEYSKSSNKDLLVPDNTVLYEKAFPFANVSKYVVVPAVDGNEDLDDEARIDLLNKFNSFIAPTTGAANVSEKEDEVASLDDKQIVAICDAVEKLMNKYSAAKQYNSELKEAQTIFTRLELVLKLFVGKSALLYTKMCAALVRLLSHYVGSFVKSSMLYAMTVSQASLTYCAVSMK
jgi:hypothetical protein